MRALRPLIVLGLASISLSAAAQEGGQPAPLVEAGASEPCELVVLDLRPSGLADAEKHLPTLLSEAVAAEIESTTTCRVRTQANVMSMMQFEADKVACGVEGDSSCLVDLSNALGVSRVVTGTVGKLGASYTIQLQLQDTALAQVMNRASRKVSNGPDNLDEEVRLAARALVKGVLPPRGESDGPHDDESVSLSTLTWTGIGLTAGGAAVGVVGAALFILAEVQNETGLFGWKREWASLGEGEDALGVRWSPLLAIGWSTLLSGSTGAAVAATGVGLLGYSLTEGE